MLKSLNLFAAAGLGTAAILTVAVNFADRNVSTFGGEPIYLADGSSNVESLLIAAANASPEHAGVFGLGRIALPEEIAAWDLDVSPDGTGLPVGSGSVEDGENLFSDYCAVCHGEFAEGVGNWPKLSGGDGTLADEDPLKTVGSYWPHLSTGFDYVRRSMPFGNAQSLSDDEVYAIVAYILYSNDLIDDDFELSKETFLDVEMPNAGGFIIDDRAQTEYAVFTEACMSDCKDSVEITMRALVLDVTPEEEGAEEAAAEPVVEVAAVEEAPAESEVVAVAFDAELAAEGEKVFKKCKACHQVGEGATNKTGPVLNGVVGASIGHIEDFRYSKVFGQMKDDGMVWDEANLAAFLAKPKDFAKGTKMSFAGLRKDSEIASVIEYLKQFQ